MKGQISRISHNPAKGYSGLYHNQGAMITDSDLNESTALARLRVEQMGNDTILDGVPAKGGCVGIQHANGGTVHHPFLKQGIVYADGVRGTVRDVNGKTHSAANPLDLLKSQVDFPDPPGVDANEPLIVYADIWHRTVHPLEDGRMTEVALHGAATAFRTKTMTQIKLAPAGAADSIANGSGAFPRIGSGRLAVSDLDNSDTGNDCDPCATQIPVENTVTNSLLRIEIVDVEGLAQNPNAITLAWSSENAAEIAALDALPDGFGDGTFVYEHFDITTESHKGVFADPSTRATPDFLAAINKSHARGHVRRWDGHCRYEIDGPAGPTLGRNKGDTKNGRPGIAFDFFRVDIDFEDAHAIVGDYWLIELRTNAHHDATDDNRIHVVSKLPLGIEHHYALLFHIDNGKPLPLTDAERRSVSFPVLSDLPADHVSFTNNCADIYGPPNGDGAKNVQQALDRLCGLNATQIRFDNPCRDLFGSADTVHEALTELCDADFGSDRSWMKFVLDWGVTCGLKVRLVDNTTISVTPGTYLDQRGDFVTADWSKTKTFPVGKIRLTEEARQSNNEGSYCLGIERFNGTTTNLVIGLAEEFVEANPTFKTEIANCEAARSPNIFDETVAKLPEKSAQTFGYALNMSVSGAWANGGMALRQSEYDSNYETIMQLADAYSKAYSAEDTKTMRERMDRVITTYMLDGFGGTALEQQRGNQIAALINLLIGQSEEFVNACKCWAIWPECPEEAEPRVPLASIDLKMDNGDVRDVFSVCMLTCRRQAMTPRSMVYHFREMFETMISQTFVGEDYTVPLSTLKSICCPREQDNSGQGAMLDYQPWILPEATVAKGPVADNTYRKYYDIYGMSLEAAAEVLEGNGIDVEDYIDVQKDEARDLLANLGGTSIDERLGLQDRVGPGDRVVMLTKGDQAVGYVIVERQPGKYVYPTAKSRSVERALAKSAAITAVSAGHSQMDNKTDAIAGRIAMLETQMKGLDAQISEKTALLQDTITKLAAATDDVTRARKEFALLDAETDTAIRTLREERPVTALAEVDSEIFKLLSAHGIVTIAELSTLDSAKLTAISDGAAETKARLTDARLSAAKLLGQ
ncbi:DUF6519 domain-containing protein [Palleronia caenipelagi]|uniref:Uncharacterized protein n=1 Tax=Palleronia caenipelagi TaxID=2489174 RepID=A0A547PPM4_9RHOB|nr:DUF6519 domain-containing protein [Palleronia caenipelagi]TRD16103.1 hypothetical protein FEV53_14560 [Palleronia caenipelagi]